MTRVRCEARTQAQPQQATGCGVTTIITARSRRYAAAATSPGGAPAHGVERASLTDVTVFDDRGAGGIEASTHCHR